MIYYTLLLINNSILYLFTTGINDLGYIHSLLAQILLYWVLESTLCGTRLFIMLCCARSNFSSLQARLPELDRVYGALVKPEISQFVCINLA